MIKERIKYTDYEGNACEEDFFFHLSKAEVAEMEISDEVKLSEKLKSIVKSKDKKEIIAAFKELILASYGVKSQDGKRFSKNQEHRDSFAESEAYSELFMKLATNAKAAEIFVNGILPTQDSPKGGAKITDRQGNIEIGTSDT